MPQVNKYKYKRIAHNIYTIYENSGEQDEELLTRENSTENTENVDNVIQISDQKECQLKTLIKLTAFETQNISKRINELIFNYEKTKYKMRKQQLSQLSFIDSISSQESSK
ncbi:Hypothetical_protein [Hexamita inflata]|uniref:Hypothetical_protein n=1 Tax=Hexamita inflata TaxID=28002 RepID=A0AA86NNA7_9EUKA|nr:Hypothetical protein HINF_LOCUS10177 [Hexamita inflata]